MELKDFIAQTIKQVAEGVAEGHKYVVDNQLATGVDDGKATTIVFDVAVLTDEESKSGGSGKIAVASVLHAVGGKEVSLKNTNQSRIQFNLNVYLKTGGARYTGGISVR